MSTNPGSNASIDEAVKQKGDSVKQQSGAGLILQAHCLSVEAQPALTFEGFEKLQGIKDRANNALVDAKKHARLYLNDLQPRIITTITSMEEYFILQNAVGTLLESASREDGKTYIRQLQERVQDFGRDSISIRDALNRLRTDLSTDQAMFAGLTNELNALATGDNSELKSINEQLSSIQGKIGGCATGIVLGALAVVGGSVMFIVGAFSTAVTGGAAAALCVGGAAVLAVGVGAVVGSSIALAGLMNMRSELLAKREKLTMEVTIVNNLSHGFGELAHSSSQAQESAQMMANAWSFTGDHLETLYKNLDKGNTDIPVLRKLFLTAAGKSVATVQQDIELIKVQMTTPQRRADIGRSISALVEEEARTLKRAA